MRDVSHWGPGQVRHVMLTQEELGRLLRLARPGPTQGAVRLSGTGNPIGLDRPSWQW
jgi:hypothetical protein